MVTLERIAGAVGAIGMVLVIGLGALVWVRTLGFFDPYEQLPAITTSLVRPADVAAFVQGPKPAECKDEPLGYPRSASRGCSWSPAAHASGDASLSVNVRLFYALAGLTGSERASNNFSQGQQYSHHGHDVAGIGDEAYNSSLAGTIGLTFRQGNAIVSVFHSSFLGEVTGNPASAKTAALATLAKTLAGRLAA